MNDCSLSNMQTPRHQGNGNRSLRFGLFVGSPVFTLSFFWIFLQFLGGYCLSQQGIPSDSGVDAQVAPNDLRFLSFLITRAIRGTRHRVTLGGPASLLGRGQLELREDLVVMNRGIKYNHSPQD